MIYTLGESLMDIIITSDGQTEEKPGGSMLNVAVSLGRAGKEVSLISEIGDDETGRALTAFLSENGISTQLVRKYPGCRTSVAKATLDAHHKPDYTFTKAYPEQRSLPYPPEFTPRDIFIFGSMYSRDPDIRKDINAYVNSAKRGGALIVYDPNIRQGNNIDHTHEMLFKNLADADVIKGSDEDFMHIFRMDSIGAVKDELRKVNSRALIITTLGEKGSMAFFKHIILELPAIKTHVVSTIGAGDAFTAGLVNSIIDQSLIGGFDIMTEDHLKKILMEGTRFSSRVCRTMDNYIPVA